jgi:beta-phosphoglucomutase-like phosphatase (HAD superfamily)
MIRAIIFDLDGTLVKTEMLKARSYARAVRNLCPAAITETHVLEDCPAGVSAALGAGMWCIAVAAPCTRESLHAEHFMEAQWIVDDPSRVARVVEQMMDERKTDMR